MDNIFNIPSNAIKTVDKLLQNFKEETIDEVEDSIKSLKKNFKSGNYLAIAMFFIILGVSSILSQYFNGNYFLQAMSYFAMASLCIVTFGTIIWRILK
tara:strand:+ start:783 stop:1076 length:294 start_codon:yes stop_codon:yes gene_type:complete